MKKTAIIATILLALVISITAAGQQKGQGKGVGRDRGFNIDRLTKVLNLTDEQASQIQKMHYENQKAEIELRSSMERNRLEIKNMVATNNIVDSEILNLSSNTHEIMGELKTNKLQLWLDVYKILNAEQQEQWTQFFNKMGDKARSRAGRMKQERIREHAPEMQ